MFHGDARDGFTERTIDRGVISSRYSFNNRIGFTFEELVQHYNQLEFLQEGVPSQVWVDIIKPELLANEHYFKLFMSEIAEN